MSKKKLEKPENMAIEGTARMATVTTEPNFMAGATAESMTIDGVPIEEVIKANLILKTNDDGKVTGLDVDRLETMTNSDGSVTFYADRLVFKNMLTGEEVDYTQRKKAAPSDKINIGVFDISIKGEEIEIFDGNQWVGIRIELDEWPLAKEAVDKLIADNEKTQEKRQPIKEKTLDEFNNSRSVSYGNYIRVEPLTDK